MVGERAVLEPLLPEALGPGQPLERLLVAHRHPVLGPAERRERHVALAHRGARPRPGSLEPQPQVGHQPQLEVHPLRPRDRLAVAGAGVLPVDRQPAVVEGRLALELDLGRPLDALDHPQQHVIGVVVGRRAAMAVRALGVVMPRSDAQRVADDHPAHAGLPARLDHHRARDVAPAGRDVDVGRADPEAAGVAVEHRREHARGVHPRQAHPLDVAVRRDQRRRLAVGQERVIADRRERADPNPLIALCPRHPGAILPVGLRTCQGILARRCNHACK